MQKQQPRALARGNVFVATLTSMVLKHVISARGIEQVFGSVRWQVATMDMVLSHHIKVKRIWMRRRTDGPEDRVLQETLDRKLGQVHGNNIIHADVVTKNKFSAFSASDTDNKKSKTHKKRDNIATQKVKKKVKRAGGGIAGLKSGAVSDF